MRTKHQKQAKAQLVAVATPTIHSTSASSVAQLQLIDPLVTELLTPNVALQSEVLLAELKLVSYDLRDTPMCDVL